MRCRICGRSVPPPPEVALTLSEIDAVVAQALAGERDLPDAEILARYLGTLAALGPRLRGASHALRQLCATCGDAERLAGHVLAGWEHGVHLRAHLLPMPQVFDETCPFCVARQAAAELRRHAEPTPLRVVGGAA